MHEVLDIELKTVSLKEMSAVKLMNRTDTKFLTTEATLMEFLRHAKEDYLAQEVGGEINLPYFTRYYDTEDCEMYYRHLHGCHTRKKVRVRRYECSGLEYLEVKSKNNKRRTDKKRVVTSSLSDDDRRRFLLDISEYDSELLIPRIENRFDRLTLVNNDMTERLTIDTALRFRNLVTGVVCDLNGLVIIELKRDDRFESPSAGLFRRLHISQSGFSKYCIGMALSDPTLRNNRFKPRIYKIRRMLSA